MNDLCTLSIEPTGDATIARLDGEIDLSNAEDLGRAIDRLTDERDVQALVLDLSDVAYMDSSAVRLIMRLRTRCRERNTALRVVGPPSSRAARILDIAGMNQIVPLLPTTEAAIRTLTSGGDA